MEILTLTTIPDHWDDPVFSRAEAESLLAQSHHVLFAAGESGIGGHLLARLVPHTPADVLTLYVPPTARRCGHAKALVEAAIATARRAGCPALTLEVSAENAAAVALYTVCGLQQVAKRLGYYPSSVSNLKADALVLSIALS